MSSNEGLELIEMIQRLYDSGYEIGYIELPNSFQDGRYKNLEWN